MLLKEVQFIWNIQSQDKKRWPFNTVDCNTYHLVTGDKKNQMDGDVTFQSETGKLCHVTSV